MYYCRLIYIIIIKFQKNCYYYYFYYYYFIIIILLLLFYYYYFIIIILFITTADNILYIIELTVGFERNLNINASRKKLKYHPLLVELDKADDRIEFVNLCMSSLGIFGNSSDSFLQMCNDIGIDKHHLNFIVTKSTQIFCMRNKPWSQPALLKY